MTREAWYWQAESWLQSRLTGIVSATRIIQGQIQQMMNTTDTKELPDSYIEAELNAFSRLCDYIKNELFQNNDIIELVQLNLGYQMSSRQQTTHLRKKT